MYLLLNARVAFVASVKGRDGHVALAALCNHARFIGEMPTIAARYGVLGAHTHHQFKN